MDTPDMKTPQFGLSLRVSRAATVADIKLQISFEDRAPAPSRQVSDTRVGFVVANEGGALYHEHPVGTMSYAISPHADARHHQVS
jgi:hypothetical protein